MNEPYSSQTKPATIALDWKLHIFNKPFHYGGARGGAVGCSTVLQAGRLHVRFLMSSLEFFINIIWPHYGPGVDSASNRNGYQEYFLVGKGNRCIGLANLPPSCAVLESGSLNLLAPSGPVQTCTGIAIPNPLVKYTGTNKTVSPWFEQNLGHPLSAKLSPILATMNISK